MTNFVHSHESLYAFLIGPITTPSAHVPDHTKFIAWSKRLTIQDVHFTSLLSVAMVRAGIYLLPNIDRAAKLKQLESKIIAQFANSLLQVDEDVLDHFATLAGVDDSDPTSTIPFEQLIEVGTALSTGYTYVARLTPELVALQSAFSNLNILDPWT